MTEGKHEILSWADVVELFSVLKERLGPAEMILYPPNGTYLSWGCETWYTVSANWPLNTWEVWYTRD